MFRGEAIPIIHPDHLNRKNMKLPCLVLIGILLGSGSLANAGDNLIENGNFADAKPLPQSSSTKEELTIQIVPTPPMKGKGLTGKHCLEIDLLGERSSASWSQRLFVDAAKSYHLRCILSIPSDGSIELGGYAYNAEGMGAPLEVDGRTWQYSLASQQVATDGWIEFETVVGAKSTEERTRLPPNAEWIQLVFWVTKGPAKFYIAVVSMEEIGGATKKSSR
jgi:hypothetical protein